MLCSFERMKFLVAMAEGKHPFPYRTRKLSPPAPMVLGAVAPGRVGRCQINFSSFHVKVEGAFSFTFFHTGQPKAVSCYNIMKVIFK